MNNYKSFGGSFLRLLRMIIVAISFVEAMWLAFLDPVRPGLQLLFALPLVFGIAVGLFGDIFYYKGIGLKIYYIIACIRYLIQPILLVMSKGKLSSNRMSVVQPISYYVSTIIACVEILIVFYTILKRYPRVYNKFYRAHEKSLNTENPFFKVTGIKLGGWLVVLIYIGVLIARAGIWLPALNIYGFKTSTISGILLENTLFSCVKTILFIVFLERAVNSKGKQRSVYLFLCVIAILFNVLSYMGSNRSLTIEIVLASVLLMIFYFPQYKHQIAVVTLPVACIVIFSMFVTKQFGLETASNISSVDLSIQYISNQIEEYTNGPWCIAQTYEGALGISPIQSFKAVGKEITNALMIVLEIPGLKFLRNITADWLSATDLFRNAFEIVNRGQIPSFSAGFFYVSEWLGWILFPLGNYVATRFLIKYTVEAEFCTSALKKYTYIWSSILFGLMHCYCARVLLYCMSKYIWFLWLVLAGNKLNLRIGKHR